MNRNILYNKSMNPEDISIELLKEQVSFFEGFNAGDYIYIADEDAAFDVDTNLPIPVGDYKILPSDESVINIKQCGEDGESTGKEYSIDHITGEKLVAGGHLKYYESLEEGGKNSGRKENSVNNPKELHVMFKKGYLKKTQGTSKPTKLLYSKNAFKEYGSGNKNPEFYKNKKRKDKLQHKRSRSRKAAGTERAAKGSGLNKMGSFLREE